MKKSKPRKKKSPAQIASRERSARKLRKRLRSMLAQSKTIQAAIKAKRDIDLELAGEPEWVKIGAVGVLHVASILATGQEREVVTAVSGMMMSDLATRILKGIVDGKYS